jgi:Carboxypeptidase regulatory-like domain/TonB dependent receptor
MFQEKFQRNIRFLVLSFSLVCLLAAIGWSQVSTSSITGTVVDQSNAVISGASVKVTNEDTGVSYETRTSSSGSYAVPSVTPGRYTVTVSNAGFDSFTSQHNVLSVGAPLVVNATLQIGAAQQVIQVEASYQRIETTNAAISNVVTTQEVKTLPLNGRNPLSLLTLEPGVVQRTTESQGSGTHVFGSRDRSHNVTIDGIDANESTVPNPQSNIQRLNPDNVQEFRTVTLDPTAEYGRNSGANVMVATKIGSNAIHGDVFYFNRNTVFNANEWFNNYSGQPRPDLKLNQYGFDVGGPIIKNKTFFFGDFQFNDIKQSGPISTSFGIPRVYSAPARNGLIRFVRGKLTFNGKSYTRAGLGLADANGNLLPGVPTCTNGVIANCVDTYNIFGNDPANLGPDRAVIGLINSTPLPNTFSAVGDGVNVGGFNWNPPTKFTGPNYMVRVDHTFGPNDNVFVRYLQNHYNTLEGDFLNARPQVFPGFPPLGEVFRNGKNLAVSYRHTFSPNLVNEFTTGFNRFAFTFTFGESNKNFGDPTKLPVWSDACVFPGSGGGLTGGSFLNIDSPNCVSPHTARAVTAPQFVDNLSWVHGSHTIRTGFNIRMYYHNDSRGFFGTGILAPVVFFDQSIRTGGFNNVPDPAGIKDAGGNVIAGTVPSSNDLTTLQQAIVELSGIPAGIQQGYQADFGSNTYNPGRYATVYTRARQYDTYIQDEWHVKPRLTVNAGLRWEINPPPFDNKQTLVPNLPVNGSQGLVSFKKSDRWYKSSNLGSIGPRLGVAWSPDDKMVIRAGYGWLFDTISTFQITSIAGKVPGFIQTCNVTINANGSPNPPAGCISPSGTQNRISQGFPISVPAPSATPSSALTPPPQPYNAAPNIGAFDPNLKNPSVHEWDLTIQRELPGKFVAEIGYVGKRGTHLYRAYDLNQIRVDQPGFLDSFNIARQNALNGCNPDGSNCPGAPKPTLLLQMTSGSFLNGTTSVTNFLRNNIGNLAQRIDQLAGTGGVQQIVQRGFPANYFRPNAQFRQIFYFDSGGDSYYNGAFLAVRRRFEQGLDFGMTYTFSKSIDDMSVDPVGASTGGGLSTTNSRTPTDVNNFALDRARSDFDNRHVVTANMVYEFPFGKGKKWGADWNGVLNQILGGWGFTGIFNYQSGEPYTIQSGSQTANNTHVSSATVVGPLIKGGDLQFVPGVEGPVLYNAGGLITDTKDLHFNCNPVVGTQTFFCIPLPGQQGSGRNFAQGPNFWNLDSGLFKNFKMTERFNMQFRAEVFNVFNHPNFENPRNSTQGSPTITSSFFGQVCCSTSALASSANVNALGEPNRIIQLGLKLNF